MCSNQLCTLPEFGEEKTIVGKLSHMDKKNIPKSIPTLHFCIFWEKE